MPAGPAAPPLAAAGGALAIQEPAIYAFNGSGESLIADLLHAREGDIDAMSRLHKFNAALTAGDHTNSLALATAYNLPRQGVRSDLATAAIVGDGDVPANFKNSPTLAADLMLRAIDKGRPLVSRCRVLPITNGDPFKVPEYGEFDGVADHPDKTAHAAEGTMSVTGALIDPVPVSGAWRVTRDLIESSGPRIDQLVLPEMVADYRQKSETRLVAKLAAVKPAWDTALVDTATELDQELINFYLARFEAPTVVGMGTTMYPIFAKLLASDGRPYYPRLNPTNAAGQAGPGLMTLDVQGVPAVPTWSATATDAWMLYGPDVWVFESAPKTFRFEEVEGPGIVKLAIWGYQAAHVARLSSVRRIKSIA